MQIIFMFLFFSCVSVLQAQGGSGVTSTRARTIDRALYDAARLIDSRAPHGSKIALVNFNTPTSSLSSYCIFELEANLLDFSNLVIVDRAEVELRRSELHFQVSGEVSDDSMQSLGQTMGVENIISGTITEIDGVYRLIVRVLVVESGVVMAQYRTDIVNDARFRNVSNYRGRAVETAISEKMTKENEKQAKKDAKHEFLRNHPMKRGYLGVAAQISPVLDSDFNSLNTGLLTVGVELGFSVGVDFNYTTLLGANRDNLFNKETNPDRIYEGILAGSKIDRLNALGIGLHYSFFGRRLMFTFGPGMTCVLLNAAVDIDGKNVGNFVSPYGQARINCRLNSYNAYGFHLRLGYRFDINNPEMAKYEIINGISEKDWFVTHNVIAGIVITSK